ncbi:hypothetical protein EYF80_052202 [Liparis tanakae]|uniref:Uncharacterized protein n=1 Tax=Liparis tanakae TaxID=230148 RepID=A0A4Z2F9Z8_9TELE|nr:hypothetical protein EYF80_052202 [Liparis tanakae]
MRAGATPPPSSSSPGGREQRCAQKGAAASGSPPKTHFIFSEDGDQWLMKGFGSPADISHSARQLSHSTTPQLHNSTLSTLSPRPQHAAPPSGPSQAFTSQQTDTCQAPVLFHLFLLLRTSS